MLKNKKKSMQNSLFFYLSLRTYRTTLVAGAVKTLAKLTSLFTEIGLSFDS